MVMKITIAGRVKTKGLNTLKDKSFSRRIFRIKVIKEGA